MTETLFYIFSSFWAGAVHAATPGHGKTVAAAYIVGARGKPIDAVILGVFVTLSHTSGIVLVGVLAALGSAWLAPQRIAPGELVSAALDTLAPLANAKSISLSSSMAPELPDVYAAQRDELKGASHA